MANQAARQDQPADGNTPSLRPDTGVALASGARRGSADSFRELLARLKTSNDQIQSQLAAEAPVAAPEPPPVPAATAASSGPAAIPAAVVIPPNPAFLPPEPVQAISQEPVAPAPDPVAPVPIPTVDAKEQERRARMRAEAHAASQEIIARLRKAAGHDVAAKQPPAAEPVEPAAAEEAATPTAGEPTAELAVEPELIVADEPAPIVPEDLAAELAAVLAPPQSEQVLVQEQTPALEQGRRRHPFFPDVYLDDSEEAPPALAEAAPAVEVEQVAPEAELPAVVEETAPEISYVEEPAPETEPEPVAEAEVEPSAELVEAEPEAMVPPQAVVAEAQVEQPETAAEDPEDGHQEELIEDEADAVRHLHGMEVKGIGDIAKAIFTPPSPAERAEFLAAIRAATPDDSAPAEVLAADKSTLETPAQSVRRVAPADDPFAKIAPDAALHVNNDQPDEDSGELARSLLDMMLSSPSAGLPQERALAADALLKLIPKVPTKSLITISERLSLMESPPNLLIAKLINDPRIEISGPLLEQCNHISDQVLGKVIGTGQISLQRLIARRRHLSAALTDQLIEFDDPSVLLTLVRNSGATISHAAFTKLMQHATSHTDALAPLATRSDLPPTVAFELFWFVPAELRRYLLSRFLTDSETLTKILKITKVMEGGEDGESQFAEKSAIEDFVTALAEGRQDDAVQMLAAMSRISAECAARIIADRQGEAIAIVFKAIGLNRAQFEEYAGILQRPEVGIINPERVLLELQSTFNSMSFNKARIVLTYWDWAVLRHGPYAESQ